MTQNAFFRYSRKVIIDNHEIWSLKGAHTGMKEQYTVINLEGDGDFLYFTGTLDFMDITDPTVSLWDYPTVTGLPEVLFLLTKYTLVQ